MDYLAFTLSNSLEGEAEYKANKKFDNLPDYHLRNPLHPMRYLYKDIDSVPRRVKSSIIALKAIRRNLVEGSPEDLTTVVCNMIPKRNRNKLYIAIGDVITRARLDESAISSMSGIELETIIGEVTKDINLFLWDGMRFWGDVLLIMNALSSRRPVPACAVTIVENCCAIGMKNAQCYITGSMIGLEGVGEDDCMVCYDSDWVRMASDVLTQRFLLNFASLLGSRLNSVVYPEWGLIEKVLNWGDNVLLRYGGDGFKLIKTYEAICIGVLLSRGADDSIVDTSRFLKNTINDIFLESKAYGDAALELVEIIRSCESHHHITQLYGLHRLWGHPIVDNRKGMEKVRDIGRKKIVRDDSMGVRAARFFKMNFCEEYRRKYKKYPNVADSGVRLSDLIRRNDPEAGNRSVISDSEWDSINFETTFSIPETFNLSMIVSDKAISLTKSELIKNIRTRRTVMNPEKRRGVLRWINDVTINPKTLLQDVNDKRFPDDQKIIGLTPKERELNPTPRMFALMSHLLRIYVVVTEQMLSEHVLPMFPQITMTDSLLDLTKKTYSISKRQAPSMRASGKGKHWASRTVCMSLDFEKWNGHMRKESTFAVFESIGQLFGMSNLFNETYDLFEESYLYLADGSYIPAVKDGILVEEGSLSFSGHKGGMEGLRQKGWTIFTVCCLDMVCSKYNCTYKIMGMGDNQVLQITVYTYNVDGAGQPSDSGKQEMKKVIEELFSDLISSFGKLGLPLKPLETWMSEDLHLYGKYPVWRGVPLCMDLKKTMRMFAYSNDDIMTLENALGTIYGNAASATQGSCFCQVPYLVGILMSSLCVMDFLNYHPFLGEGLSRNISSDMTWRLSMPKTKTKVIKIGEHGMNSSMIRLMIQLIPRALGGYNSLNLYELMMRGFPDNLSRDLSYLYKIKAEANDGLKSCLNNWISPLYMPTRNYQLLIEDVSSVNVISPRTPLSGVRQTVEKFISDPSKIKNTEFRELMSGKVRDQAKALSRRLCDGDILHIRLLHDIYESTIIGYIDSILSKVTKASTIQRLAVEKSSFDSMSAVFDDEINYFRFFVWRCSVNSGEKVFDCPTTHAKVMREKGWGKKLKGVTTPFPWSYLSLTTCGEDKVCSCDDGYISVHFPDRQLTEFEWNTTIGRSPPYLGSMTKEKVITGTIGKAYSTEPLIKRPLKLMRVINWYVPSQSNMASVIRATVSAVTDSDPTMYEGKLEGTAGAEIHRYRDTSLKHGALTTSNYLYPTRYHISTDNFTRYSKGGENYDVHFQACLCSIVEQTNIGISACNRNGMPIEKFQHYKQVCYECISVLDETFEDLPSADAADLIPYRKKNTYLYVAEKDIQDSLTYSPLISLKLPYVSNSMYSAMTKDYKYRWLVDTIADFICCDICSGGGNESFFTIGLTDVKSYERTMFLKFEPEDVFRCVVSRLILFSKTKCSSKGKRRLASAEESLRYLDGLLMSAGSDSFTGLAMFFSWEETYRKIKFSNKIVMPNTVPATLSSSCEAVRRSLIGLIREEQHERRERINYYVTEDGKNNRFIHNLMLCEMIIRESNCEDCKLALVTSKFVDIATETVLLKCDAGHLVFSHGVKLFMSHVTIERLRKDSEKRRTIRKSEAKRRLVPPLAKVSVTELINFRKLRQRMINWNLDLQDSVKDSEILGLHRNKTSESSLRKIYSLPTSSLYKYIDLFSVFLREIKGKKTFLLGDGLGATANLLNDMTGNQIIVSTILETDDAMPQSYPHLLQPGAVSSSTDIDRSTMINMVNDIISTSWSDDWRPVVNDCSVVISDIEIMGRNEGFSRDLVQKKILELKDWDFALIKDYIYSLEELYDRLRFILSKPLGQIRLVSTGMKTVSVPEMWWVLGNTVNDHKVQLSYDPRGLIQEWERLVEGMHLLDAEGTEKSVVDDMNARIRLNVPITDMINQIRWWTILPGVGCSLPVNGNYTQLFYRLSKGKRPSHMHMERENKSLRMYTKDYFKLREILFGMAVSMLANIADRKRMMEESERWLLDWEIGKSYSDWYPYLYLSTDVSSSVIDVGDYVPILSCIMAHHRLSFGKIGRSIRFKKDIMSKREVFFPISGTADLKIKKTKL